MRQVRGAGDLNNYLELQRTEESQDASGFPVQGWKKVTNLWASIQPIGGNEQLRGRQIEAGVTTIVTAHYRDGVTPGMRFKKGNRILNIKRAYDRDDDRKWLECQCEEVVSV